MPQRATMASLSRRLSNATSLTLLLACGGSNTRDETLTRRVDSLANALALIEAQVSLDRTLSDVQGVAYLTPGSDGYSVVRMDLGQLTFALEDVQPYANGTQIALRVGNPLSATIRQLSLTVEWGKLKADGKPDNDNVRSKEMEFSEELQPGSWSRLRVVFEGTPPTQLGFVRIKNVNHGGLRLRS